MRLAILIFVAATTAFGQGECCAAWVLDAEGGFVFDDNLSRAQLAKDIKSDTAFEASVTAGRQFRLTDSTSVTVTANLRDARYARFSGLDHTDLGLTAAARTKFGMGSFAPWVRAGLSATRLDFRSDIRDGWLYAAGFGGGKRISDRIELAADYAYEYRKADDVETIVPGKSNDVFSQKNHTTSVRADFGLSASTLLLLAYSRRSGDITSTTQKNIAIFKTSSALAPDTVFGAGGVAYKLGATTHALSIGTSYAVSPRASLNFAVERTASYGEGNINYYVNTVRAAFLYSF
jgi:hypothetical protein